MDAMAADFNRVCADEARSTLLPGRSVAAGNAAFSPQPGKKRRAGPQGLRWSINDIILTFS